MPKLKNDQHERFSQEYLKDLSKTHAAIRAGYSEKSAKEIGYRLFTNVHIEERIIELQAERAKRVGVEQDDVLRQLDVFRLSKISDYVELKTVKKKVGTKGKETEREVQELVFKDFDKLTEDQLMCIEFIKHGKHGIELRLQGKEWTIEKINRHIGFYLKDHDQAKPDGPTINLIHKDGKVDLSE